MSKISSFLVATIFLCFCAIPAFGQSLNGSVDGYGSVWPDHSECYQNRLGVESSVEATWNGIEARPYLQYEWWGTCNAKIAGSPLNAEATHALRKIQGAVVEYRFDVGLGIGARIHREAVHQIWANPSPKEPNRHDWFPHDDSWRGAERRCSSGKTCPSVGYEEGVGPNVSIRGNQFFISVAVPVFIWKNLTYTPNDVLVNGTVQLEAWTVTLRSNMNRHQSIFFTITAVKDLDNRFSIGVTGGRYDAPDWSTPPFWMGGFAFQIH